MTPSQLVMLSAGIYGLALIVMAFRVPSLLARMEAKRTIPPAELAKYRKFLRPACIVGALCCIGAVLLALMNK